MSTDADSVPAPKPSPSNAPVARKKKKGAKRAKIVRPLTEAEINTPDMQTLIMLGVLAATTIVLWVFAHAGCNYHPPRETRRQRDVTTADLTREPKDAAIEFQQRLLTLNYVGALEIVAGPLVQTVKEQQAPCQADRAGCDAKRLKLQNAVTAGVVLSRTPVSAKVRVTTFHLPGGDQSFLTLVERDGATWKVTARVPDAPGATLPEPSLPQPIHFNVAPTGSTGSTLQLVPAPGPGSSASPSTSAAPHGAPIHLVPGVAAPISPAPAASH